MPVARDEQVGRQPAHLVVRQGHRGQPGPQPGREHRIDEAHDRDGVRDAQPRLLKRLVRAEADAIVQADQRGEPGTAQQAAHRRVPVRRLPRTVDGAGEPDPGARELRADAAPASPRRVQRPGPVPDEIDALAVPGLQQAPRRRAPALDLVGYHCRAPKRIGEAVQQHDRLPVEYGRNRHGP
jgi:hypothetical protein